MQTIEQTYETVEGIRARQEPRLTDRTHDFPNKAWQLATLAKVYQGAGLSPDDAWDAAVADMEALWDGNDE